MEICQGALKTMRLERDLRDRLLMDSVASSSKLLAVQIPEQHSPGEMNESSMTFHPWRSGDPSVGTRAFAQQYQILSRIY